MWKKKTELGMFVKLELTKNDLNNLFKIRFS